MSGKWTHALTFLLGITLTVGVYESLRLVRNTSRALAVASNQIKAAEQAPPRAGQEPPARALDARGAQRMQQPRPQERPRTPSAQARPQVPRQGVAGTRQMPVRPPPAQAGRQAKPPQRQGAQQRQGQQPRRSTDDRRQQMRDKMDGMSEEERAAFKERRQSRRGQGQKAGTAGKAIDDRRDLDERELVDEP